MLPIHSGQHAVPHSTVAAEWALKALIASELRLVEIWLMQLP